MAAQQTVQFISKEEYESEQCQKARRVLKDYLFHFHCTDPKAPVSCHVFNPQGKAPETRKGYQIVETPEGLTCSCESFRRSGSATTCKHVSALQEAFDHLGMSRFIELANRRSWDWMNQQEADDLDEGYAESQVSPYAAVEAPAVVTRIDPAVLGKDYSDLDDLCDDPSEPVQPIRRYQRGEW